MPDPSPRPTKPSATRWARFSLRTLFVLMTVVGCWLGWESNIVRTRKAVLREVEAKRVFQFVSARAFEEQQKSYPPGLPREPLAKVSFTRQLLGDEAIQRVWYYRYVQAFAEEDLLRLQKTFPEAEFQESLPPPCHPGCFPRHTLVATADGERPIESLRPGCEVRVVRGNDELGLTAIQTVFTTKNRLWRIATADGELVTTETQPLRLADQQIRLAGKLVPGDRLLRLVNGELLVTPVLAIEPTGRWEDVFNLVLGDSQCFVAGGFVVRSKPPPTTLATDEPISGE